MQKFRKLLHFFNDKITVVIAKIRKTTAQLIPQLTAFNLHASEVRSLTEFQDKLINLVIMRKKIVASFTALSLFPLCVA